MAAAAPFAAAALTAQAADDSHRPRAVFRPTELMKDVMGTVTAVGKMGYQVVEF